MASTQSRTLVVKMSEGDEIRRFTTNALTYADLAHRVTESFGLPNGSFVTKYAHPTRPSLILSPACARAGTFLMWQVQR